MLEKSSQPKVYGIDLDGVCFNFLEGFGNYLCKQHNICIPLDKITDYHWTGVDESLKQNIWNVYFHDFCRAGGMGRLNPIDGAAESLQHLMDSGHQLHFISSREDYVEAETIESIETKLGIKKPSVFIVKGKKKSPYVNRLGVEVFIDDSPTIIAELVENTRAKVYTMDYPYNRHITHETSRVTNWNEFLISEGCILSGR
jgi:uncharacterized HAD superfamily protein